MYRTSLFHHWIPRRVQNVLLFILVLPTLVTPSIYSADITEMYSALGVPVEILSYANNANTIGLMFGLGIVFKFFRYLRPKITILSTFIGMAICSVMIGMTDDPIVIIAASLLMGFIKIFGMLILITPFTLLLSPTGDRGRFYAILYPIVLSIGQLNGYISSELTYVMSWQSIYLVAAIILLVCTLLGILTLHNHWTAKPLSVPTIDWLGATLFVTSALLLNYVLVYAKQEGWFEASPRLVIISGAFIVSTVLFIWWQLRTKTPFVPLDVFKKRSVLTAIVLFLLMGMYMATSFLQSGFTSFLRYDSNTNALLNLSIIPGVIIGGVIGFYWFKYERSMRTLLFFAFGNFMAYTISLYLLISPVFDISYFILPSVFKGIGLALVYIGGGFYFASSIAPAQLMAAYPVVIGIRSFIGTAFFSAVFSWAQYRLQWDNMSNLAGQMDAADILVQQRGNAMQLYSLIQQQATLMAIKELLGYVALASIVVMIYISVHPFYRLKHRKVILLRKRFSGEPTVGYHDDSTENDDDDRLASAAGLST